MNKMCSTCKKQKVCKHIDMIDETLEYFSVHMDDDIIRISLRCLYREDENSEFGDYYFPFSYNPKCGYN